MAVKTITYTYKTGGLYVHSDETLNLSAFTKTGDTSSTVAKILSITASTSINQHASSSSTDCSIAIRINYSGGSTTSTTATKTNMSRGSTKSVSMSWNDVSGIASNWGTVTTVVVDKSGGTYTNWQKYPLVITITFDDTQYKPTISNFTMTRCDSSGTADPQNGTYVKMSATFTKSGGTETRTDRPSSITLKYGSTTVTLASDISTINSSWLTTKTWGPTGGFLISNGYTFTLTFVYYGETVTATANVAPGMYNFVLSHLPTGGVSIGKKPSSTSGNPLFEVQYPSILNGALTMNGGWNNIQIKERNNISFSHGSALSYVGVGIGGVPAGSYCFMQAFCDGGASSILVCNSNTSSGSTVFCEGQGAGNYFTSCSGCCYITNTTNFYVWAKWPSSATSHIWFRIIYIDL